jgi:hypothetical protein
VPVAREPYFRKWAFVTSFALPDGIKRFGSVVSPLLNLIPQLLPPVVLVGASLTMLVASIEAVVYDMCQVPSHLVSPGRLKR